MQLDGGGVGFARQRCRPARGLQALSREDVERSVGGLGAALGGSPVVGLWSWAARARLADAASPGGPASPPPRTVVRRLSSHRKNRRRSGVAPFCCRFGPVALPPTTTSAPPLDRPGRSFSPRPALAKSFAPRFEGSQYLGEWSVVGGEW